MSRIKYLSILALTLSGFVLLQNPMQAQNSYSQQQGRYVPVNVMEKSTWHQAPREIQIIDERPVIRDFREAPQSARQIGLPGGPGGYSGSPSGALGSGSIPLPRADYGHSVSNISMRDMAPSTILPKGNTTGIHAKTDPIRKQTINRMSPGAQRPVVLSAPKQNTPTPTYKYANGYGDAQGSTSGSGHSSTSLHGKLLK